jgi:hypothetical protein
MRYARSAQRLRASALSVRLAPAASLQRECQVRRKGKLSCQSEPDFCKVSFSPQPG